MPVVRGVRFDDHRLAAYRGLSDPNLLRRRNLFVAEGRLIVERLIAVGHRIESVLLNVASFRALDAALSRLPHETPVFICETDDFTAITGFNLHRGCLALAERPPDRPLTDVVQDANLLLVLEGISDAGNLGSAFRNAAAFGASVLLSDTCCDPLYRKAIRTSMGSVLRTAYAHMRDWPVELETLKREGFTVIALTPRDEAIDLAALAPQRMPRRLALLVGGEGPGLTPAARSMADMHVRISMSGTVDSLNLATATGIALYHLANPVVIL